jgi:hypothetical protein
MKLVDFYKKSVELNESELGSWAPSYYGVFSKIINENNYKQVAEVGIGYGTHAKQVLRTCNIDRLYLIDPMVEYPDDAFSSDVMKHIPKIPGNNFNEFADLIKAELEPWQPKYTWFRTLSTAVTQEQIPDESLDCIFVDADHRYIHVMADLKFWWKKLRIGGQLLGDDYFMSDVSRAVGDFASQNGLTFDFLYKPGTNYKIYRFHK